MRPRTISTLPVLLLTSAVVGCDPSGDRPKGWAPAEATGGPRVLWDATAAPLPELPLPNDAATRLDPTTATGRRLNVSLRATTAYERDVRATFDQMDGFGTFAPIMVSFDAPLDLDDVWERHNQNDDYRDDAVILLNVDPDCARFGEEVGVDLGGGRHPVTFYSRSARVPDPAAPGGYRLEDGGNALYIFDPQADSRTVHFEQWNEDRNGNGALDPGEDHDLDGVLDVANFRDPAACDGLDPSTLAFDQCVADNMLSWYDRTSNTLILRPLWPMEERCTHAVLLTKRLQGEDGRAVESPFPAVHARDQEGALREAEPFLGRLSLAVDDIAFAWTFTTGSLTAPLRAARDGIHGRGPFASWADDYPASSLRFWTRAELAAAIGAEADPAVAGDRFLDGACAGAFFTWFWNEGQGEWDANLCAIEADMSSIGMLTFGTFRAPNLLVDKDGAATAAYAHEQDERWDLDPVAGTATVGAAEIPFWCALPIERPELSCSEGNPEGQAWCKPFPVALYLHGYGSNRNELSLHMGRHTAMGVAACAMDMPGHGLNRWRVDPAASSALLLAQGQLTRYGIPEFAAMLTLGRDRDLNNDGLPDGGADQWTADVFHTRDMVRQEALEHMQLVRILRSVDGRARSEDGSVLGDVDGDGAPDLGGVDNTIGAWGISLGGIVSGVLAGAEPGLDAVSPNAGGAGLTEISARSTQGGVPDAVLGPMIGPFVAGCIPVDAHQVPLAPGVEGGDCFGGRGQGAGPFLGGELRLAQFAHDAARMQTWEFGRLPGVAAGDALELVNLDNGERKTGVVGPRGFFRLSVPSDALDAIEKRVALGMGDAQTTAVATDPTLLGDRLRLTIRDGQTGAVKHTVDRFLSAVTFQGVTYPAGAPLVALQRGLGFDRNSPEIRRFTTIAQHAIAPADPGTWAPYLRETPPDRSREPMARDGGARALFMPTAGDTTVPTHTGIAHARAAGLLGSWARDPDRYGPEVGWRQLHAVDSRYGMSIERWLVATHVVEGDARLERFPDNPLVQAVIYDPDDLSDGEAVFSCGPDDWSALIGENNCGELEGQDVTFPVPRPPAGEALRADWPRAEGGVDALRVPVLRPGGQHGIYNAQPFRAFDADAYSVNLTARFLATRGRVAGHAPGCDCSAAGLPGFTYNGEADTPSFEDGCQVDDLRVCDADCAAAWGLWLPEVAACVVE
jgi:hypothetical protein